MKNDERAFMSVWLEDFEVEELREKVKEVLRSGKWSMNSLSIDMNMRSPTLKRFVESNNMPRLQYLMKIKKWVEKEENKENEFLRLERKKVLEQKKMDVLYGNQELIELREKVRNILATGNWTLPTLAKEFGITRFILSFFLSGERKPQYRGMARIKAGVDRLMIK